MDWSIGLATNYPTPSGLPGGGLKMFNKGAACAAPSSPPPPSPSPPPLCCRHPLCQLLPAHVRTEEHHISPAPDAAECRSWQLPVLCPLRSPAYVNASSQASATRALVGTQRTSAQSQRECQRMSGRMPERISE